MYQSFFKKLYYNVYARSSRAKQANASTINMFITIDGKSNKAATVKKTSEILALRKIAEFHKPESIMVEVIIDNHKTIYQESFDQNQKHQTSINSIEKTSNETQTSINRNQEIPKEIQTLTQSIQDISNNPQTSMNMEQQLVNPNGGFTGFGQMSVEDYITKKIEEERKNRKLQDLESELAQRNIEIVKLEATIGKLEQGAEANEKEVEKLQEVLESKKNIRYWAGFTGDVLESFGLKKDMIKEPLAGLIAAESDSEENVQQISIEDESGIVEDNPQDEKRNELISLIHSYLQGIDNQTLANIFKIFSEIEQDKTKAIYILEQLEKLNQR